MKKSTTPKQIKSFLKSAKALAALPTSKKFQHLVVDEYIFDAQLLKVSRLYRLSREHYIAMGGQFKPRVSSMMRSLSAQDLFKDEIDYTPSFTELSWFLGHPNEVADQSAEVRALQIFNENSLYHEQNHRVIWKLLPPAPKDAGGLRRYLNFAESLVVTLDLALGDQVGLKFASDFERMNLIYRPASKHRWHLQSKTIYQKYLLALFGTTYLALELIHSADIKKAIDYILPGQKSINQQAVQRGLELNELFTLNTNPQWQRLNSRQAQKKLEKLHKNSEKMPLSIAPHPLDLNFELTWVRSILNHYGL